MDTETIVPVQVTSGLRSGENGTALVAGTCGNRSLCTRNGDKVCSRCRLVTVSLSESSRPFWLDFCKYFGVLKYRYPQRDMSCFSTKTDQIFGSTVALLARPSIGLSIRSTANRKRPKKIGCQIGQQLEGFLVQAQACINFVGQYSFL